MASRLAVEPVLARADLAAFIDFPYRHYAADPVWVPPFRRDVKALLDRRANPFFEHGEAEYLLARKEGRVAGRIAAIHNRLHNQTHGDAVGFFGFFESEDDPAVASALLDAAAGWCAARGLDRLRGPASFSVNDECGLLVDNFVDPPSVLMAHNPPWYAKLLEGAGFEPAKDLLVYRGGSMAGKTLVPERLQRASQAVTRRLGVTIRPMDPRRFEEEIGRLKELYNAAWEKNWGFVPMTDHEIDHAAKQFRPIVVPDMAPFVELDGRPIAFALAIPDVNWALRANRSGRLFPAVLKLLWELKRKRINRVRIVLLGVLPEFRGKGLDALLYHWIWSKGLDHNITWGEAGWILEDNQSMNQGLLKMGFEVYRRYRLYDRPILRPGDDGSGGIRVDG